MKLNTNSNTYTIVYSIVVVVIVAFLLAFCYSALKSRSEANERIDKKQQILAALNIRNVSKEQVEEKYKEVVVADEIITLCQPCHTPHFLIGGVTLADADIVCDRGVEEQHVLKHHGIVAEQCLRVDVGDVVSA